MDERKFATVLFADFVDSTEVGRQHDPEVVRAAYRSTFASMQQILIAHGGTVEKFIGDAVMAVFGVPLAHEDDALRAVRSAFALRDHVTRNDAELPIRIELRVGVNTGEVVAGTGGGTDFLVTGQPVNLGARLQSAAEPGQILAGALTRELTSHHVRYGNELSVAAKGIGRVSAWPALDLLVEPTLRTVRSTDLVDRETEMGTLARTYEQVRSEHTPRLVSVIGAPGVGKSRLVNEFVARLGRGRVLRGRCVAYGDGITLAPLQSILRMDAAIDRSDSSAEAVQKLRAAAQRAFTDDQDERERATERLLVLAGLVNVEGALTHVPQESMAQELDWALRRYLEQRSAGDPITVIFEDVHWAEPSLLDTIEHLAEWTHGSVLLVCLARPEFLERRQAWDRGRANGILLSLGALSPEHTATLVSVLLPADHAGAKDEIVQRSEGNPLYAEELVRLHLERGTSRAVVPATLQGLIAARLDAAMPGVKGLLQRASVIGRVFWTDALSELGEDRGTMRTYLLEAIRRDFIVDLRARGPGGGWAYRFTHALTRDVAYASLAKSERASLHDRFGRWLETVSTSAATDELDTSASHAEQAYLFAAEVGLDRALSLGQRATTLLLAAARAVHARADYRGSESLFRRAIAVGETSGADERLLLEAKGRVAIARLRRESSQEALADVHRALEETRPHGASATLASLLQWSAMYAPYSGPADAVTQHREAVEVARRVGDDVLLAGVLRSSARPAAARGDLEEERRVLLEARELLGAHDDGVLLARILLDLANNAAARGQFTTAHHYLDEAGPLALDVVGRWMAHRAVADLSRSVGEPEQALDHAERSHAAARELGSPYAIALAAAVLGAVMRELGDTAASRGVLEQALVTARGRAPNEVVARIHSELARTYLVIGVADLARGNAERALAADPVEIPNVCAARSAFALVAAAEGSLDEALRVFRESLQLLEPTTLALESALVRLDCARVLIAAGRRPEARPLLEHVTVFYADPLASRKRAEVESLLRGQPLLRSG